MALQLHKAAVQLQQKLVRTLCSHAEVIVSVCNAQQRQMLQQKLPQFLHTHDGQLQSPQLLVHPNVPCCDEQLHVAAQLWPGLDDAVVHVVHALLNWALGPRRNSPKRCCVGAYGILCCRR